MRRVCQDQGNKDIKKLKRSFHHISIQNSLLNHRITGLERVLKTQKKHKKKSKPLTFQPEEEEYYGGAMFYTPRTVNRARLFEQEQHQEKERNKLKKAEEAAIKRANQVYEKKIAQEKREARARAKAVRVKEKEEQAAKKKRQEEARNAEKAIQLSQKGKRKASTAPIQKQKRQKQAGDSGGGHIDAGVPLTPPPITTSRGRNVRLPSKFK